MRGNLLRERELTTVIGCTTLGPGPLDRHIYQLYAQKGGTLLRIFLTDRMAGR